MIWLRNQFQFAAMMRLMSNPGQESQADRYVRIKNNPKSFELEMEQHHLPGKMKKAMHKYCDEYNGCCAIQEQMMQILMDKDIAHFSLEEADSARKVIAKKKMDKLPALKNKVFEKIGNTEWAQYIWNTAVEPQAGYAFNKSHSLPYSFVGIQTLFLATSFNPIYWNTACLIVNSGAMDDTKNDSTNYGKMAKAIGEIRSSGIKVSLIDINKSDFGFEPDEENNQILFGLKGAQNVGDDLIKAIINHRPYCSMTDFINKINPSKRPMLALVKGGAFDQFVSCREEAMAQYLWMTCDKKKRITLQNMLGLIKYDLIPHTNKLMFAKSIFEFNRYLKDKCKVPSDTENYHLTERAIDFLNKIGEPIFDSNFNLNIKTWDKVYQVKMDIFREWIADNKEQILDDLNTTIFMKDWERYAEGTVSAWEMEALCFYYGPHELQNVNCRKYGLVDFNSLPLEPIVEKTSKKGNATIPIYKLFKIAGTCIAKNATKSTAYLLTTTGVVPVKFRKEYFSMFDRQISQVQPDGSKKIIEKSFFGRGNMLIVQGIRRGEEFITKNYKSSGNSHQLYHIDKVYENGDLEVRSERKRGIEEEEND